jgi:exo-beta-1,3-glucanase (GH17 family)
MYGSRGVAETVCEVIREDKLPLRILVGAWIAPEKRSDEKTKVVEELTANALENKAEVAKAIELANKYPGIVMAISVGNESLIEWSDHRVTTDLVIGYIRQTRAAVTVPVTTCDDYNFWNKPESVAVGKECDFVSVHIYAIWNKQSLLDAMDWTRGTLASIKANHQGIPIVITEIGWATSKGTSGYQAVGIVTNPDEREQELFFRSLRDWAAQSRQPYFYFSAFDENWKGGSEPNEIEKHWGVFKADRASKKVMNPSWQ